MHILYIDESGSEQLGAGTSHFVLLGLMVPANQWKRLDRSIERIKKDHSLEEVEIHTAWMHRRYSEQERVTGFDQMDHQQRAAAVEVEIKRRSGIIGVGGDRNKIKNYRRYSRTIRPYIHLTRTERVSCLIDLAKELASWGTIRIFADAISKSDFTQGDQTPYEMAFEQVLTRFQAYLSNTKSDGLVVHDNNSTVAPRLTALSRKFHRQGTLFRQIENIVETPLFVDSSLTSMIQLADLCAYALRRFIENNEHQLWDIVQPRVDRFNDICVGVRHYTGKRPCDCPTCVAHGRVHSETTPTPR